MLISKHTGSQCKSWRTNRKAHTFGNLDMKKKDIFWFEVRHKIVQNM